MILNKHETLENLSKYVKKKKKKKEEKSRITERTWEKKVVGGGRRKMSNFSTILSFLPPYI